MTTKYEVELVIEGKRTHLGFSARKTRAVLLDYARRNADAILPHVSDEDRWSHKNGCVHFNGKVAVRFSGRTWLDCEADARLRQRGV